MHSRGIETAAEYLCPFGLGQIPLRSNGLTAGRRSLPKYFDGQPGGLDVNKLPVERTHPVRNITGTPITMKFAQLGRHSHQIVVHRVYSRQMVDNADDLANHLTRTTDLSAERGEPFYDDSIENFTAIDAAYDDSRFTRRDVFGTPATSVNNAGDDRTRLVSDRSSRDEPEDGHRRFIIARTQYRNARHKDHLERKRRERPGTDEWDDGIPGPVWLS